MMYIRGRILLFLATATSVVTSATDTAFSFEAASDAAAAAATAALTTDNKGHTDIVFDSVIVPDSSGRLLSPFDDNGDRIVGGVNASKGDFPWFAHFPSLGKYGCGGTLINTNMVVTAGACGVFDGIKNVIIGADVIIGAYDKEQEHEGGILRKCSSVWTDPRFYSGYVGNDFAVCYLSEPVLEVKPLAIFSQYVNQDATEVFQIGFGKTTKNEDDDPQLPTVLQKTVTTYHRNTYPACDRGFVQQDNLLCTYDRTKTTGACEEGDVGGPIVGRYDGEYVLIGIFSYVQIEYKDTPDPVQVWCAGHKAMGNTRVDPSLAVLLPDVKYVPRFSWPPSVAQESFDDWYKSPYTLSPTITALPTYFPTKSESPTTGRFPTYSPTISFFPSQKLTKNAVTYEPTTTLHPSSYLMYASDLESVVTPSPTNPAPTQVPTKAPTQAPTKAPTQVPTNTLSLSPTPKKKPKNTKKWDW